MGWNEAPVADNYVVIQIVVLLVKRGLLLIFGADIAKVDLERDIMNVQLERDIENLILVEVGR